MLYLLTFSINGDVFEIHHFFQAAIISRKKPRSARPLVVRKKIVYSVGRVIFFWIFIRIGKYIHRIIVVNSIYEAPRAYLSAPL